MILQSKHITSIGTSLPIDQLSYRRVLLISRHDGIIVHKYACRVEVMSADFPCFPDMQVPLADSIIQYVPQ